MYSDSTSDDSCSDSEGCCSNSGSEDLQDFLDCSFGAYYCCFWDLNTQQEYMPAACPCHIGGDPRPCAVQRKGYRSQVASRCYDVDGPHKLKLRNHMCRTHDNKTFTVFDPVVASTIQHTTIQQCIGSNEVFPVDSRFVILRHRTYMTSEFARHLMSSFETGSTISQIRKQVRSTWEANWRERAVMYNAAVERECIDPGGFTSYCNYLGSRRTLGETLCDLWGTYLEQGYRQDVQRLLQLFCRCVVGARLVASMPACDVLACRSSINDDAVAGACMHHIVHSQTHSVVSRSDC